MIKLFVGMSAMMASVVGFVPTLSCDIEDLECTFPGPPLPINFHVLDEGAAYRTSQPKPYQLENIIEQFGIATVVNLRGENAGECWYDGEAAVCDAYEVTLVNHRMSAMRLPDPEVLAGITETLLTAERPMLIHCQAGADRAGAVSAIYRMLVLGHDREDALAELSPAYFHFRFATPCMDTLAEAYEPGEAWLTEYAASYQEMVCVP